MDELTESTPDDDDSAFSQHQGLLGMRRLTLAARLRHARQLDVLLDDFADEDAGEEGEDDWQFVPLSAAAGAYTLSSASTRLHTASSAGSAGPFYANPLPPIGASLRTASAANPSAGVSTLPVVLRPSGPGGVLLRNPTIEELLPPGPLFAYGDDDDVAPSFAAPSSPNRRPAAPQRVIAAAYSY